MGRQPWGAGRPGSWTREHRAGFNLPAARAVAPVLPESVKHTHWPLVLLTSLRGELAGLLSWALTTPWIPATRPHLPPTSPPVTLRPRTPPLESSLLSPAGPEAFSGSLGLWEEAPPPPPPGRSPLWGLGQPSPARGGGGAARGIGCP